jgi:hypothetical protein
VSFNLFASANRALYCVLYYTSLLGYFVSPVKSQLRPAQRMVHLGFCIDSVTSSFALTQKKIDKFRVCRETLLCNGFAMLIDIQRFVGKCNSLRLVFPAASLFTRLCCSLISSLSDTFITYLSVAVLDEIRFWRFVDSFTHPIPWRKEQHAVVCLSSDASGFRWGSTIICGSEPLSFGDYWSPVLLASADMCLKEATAMYFTLQSVSHLLWDRRVDVIVDNEGLAVAWDGLRAKSLALVSVLKSVFLLALEYNVSLSLTWVRSRDNPADAPSRKVSASDAMLVPRLRAVVHDSFGPFSLDLMALSSNVFCPPDSPPLPFFSKGPCFGSSGINVFAQSKPSGKLYVFPPFVLIPSLIRLFLEWNEVRVVMVIPAFRKTPHWWSFLQGFVLSSVELAELGAKGVLMFPSKKGFCPNRHSLSFGLSVFDCFFRGPQVPSRCVSFSVPVKILLISDSSFKCLSEVGWPHNFRVFLRPLGGECLRASLARLVSCLRFMKPDVCVFHSGVNDISRNSVATEILSLFSDSVPLFASLLAPYADVKLIFSSLFQTRVPSMNICVREANNVLRIMCAESSWVYLSNDMIFQCDLRDDVHLDTSGIVKIHRNIVHAIQSVFGLTPGVFV